MREGGRREGKGGEGGKGGRRGRERMKGAREVRVGEKKGREE